MGTVCYGKNKQFLTLTYTLTGVQASSIISALGCLGIYTLFCRLNQS